MAKEYLDYNGLAYFWEKIKDYVSTHGGGSGTTYTVVKKSISSISISANGDTSSNSAATSNDIGIVGYNLSGTGATQITINRLYMDAGKVYYQMRNLSSTARSGLTLDVYMLRKS